MFSDPPIATPATLDVSGHCNAVNRRRTWLRICATAVVGIVLAAPAHAQPKPVNVTAPAPPPPPELSAKSFSVFTDYGEGNAIANSLRNSPPKLYTFDRASLRDVLRFLADDAGIPFISMQERAPTAQGSTSKGGSIDDILVTFTMRASPFLVLESIAKANDVALIYENGVWFIRPYNEHELFGRIYRLKYTPQERVTFNDSASSGSGMGSIGQSNAMGSNGYQSATATVPNLQLQQSQSVFKVEEPALVKEIKNMLKISSQGIAGRVAPQEASVENFPPLPGSQGINPAGSKLTGLTPEERAEPTVTFNSDTNTIYIVATRQQHQWVEGFLSAADRPQALIGIEVKFFETNKNPIKDLGINWAGTMEGGYNVTLSTDGLTGAGSIGVDIANDANRGNEKRSENQRLSTTGRGFNHSTTVTHAGTTFDNTNFNNRLDSSISNSIANTFDIYNSLRSYNAGLGGGFTATLKPDDVSFAIEAFMSDSDTTLTQYPRVLTVNNREVAISNARNQPILSGTTQTNPGGGGSTATSQVQYLPIGTQVNILPKTMPDGSVFMNVAITISNQGGSIYLPAGINGAQSPYPVTLSRIYQAALQVDSGYTLAVGGLDESANEKRANGIPGLKSIPGLGALFRSSGRSLDRRNLIVFITPTIIHDRRTTTGISEEPQTILPVRPGDPTPPTFGSDGRLVGGYTGLDDAFAWLEFQNRLFEQLIRESRLSRTTIAQIEGVIRTAEMVIAEIEFLAAQNPARTAQFAVKGERADEIVATLRDTLKKAKKALF